MEGALFCAGHSARHWGHSHGKTDIAATLWEMGALEKGSRLLLNNRKAGLQTGAAEDLTSLPLSLAVSSSTSLSSCLSLPAGSIHIIPAVPTLSQGFWQISGPATGVSSILIYQGE